LKIPKVSRYFYRSRLQLDGEPYPTDYEIVGLAGVTYVNGQPLCELVSLEDIEARHRDSNWVDFARRIRAMDDRVGSTPAGTRCGDIILVPDTKAGFNAVHEGDAYPGWHGGPSEADSRVPLAIASEALSVEGANPLLRTLIERSKKPGQPNQNQDMTRMVRKLFEEVIK